MNQLCSWHLSSLKVISQPMSALACTGERDCRTRTSSEHCTASESWTQTKYIYDPLGNLLTVNQKGGSPNSANWRTRTFTYDWLSRITHSSEPESGMISFNYD